MLEVRCASACGHCSPGLQEGTLRATGHIVDLSKEYGVHRVVLHRPNVQVPKPIVGSAAGFLRQIDSILGARVVRARCRRAIRRIRSLMYTNSVLCQKV